MDILREVSFGAKEIQVCENILMKEASARDVPSNRSGGTRMESVEDIAMDVITKGLIELQTGAGLSEPPTSKKQQELQIFDFDTNDTIGAVKAVISVIWEEFPGMLSGKWGIKVINDTDCIREAEDKGMYGMNVQEGLRLERKLKEELTNISGMWDLEGDGKEIYRILNQTQAFSSSCFSLLILDAEHFDVAIELNTRGNLYVRAAAEHIHKIMNHFASSKITRTG